MEELERIAGKEWVNLELKRNDSIRNLIKLFPHCLNAVIKSDGWYKDY
jgi:hypothetical protein